MQRLESTAVDEGAVQAADTPRLADAEPGRVVRLFSVGGMARNILLAVSFLVALRPLSDNSFLTHLATGRMMVRSASVPRSDVFTYTSGGESWIAQSWFASLIYGLFDAAGGLVAVRVLIAILALSLTALIWRLTSSSPSLIVRLVLVGMVVVGGVELWGERPLMFGLVSLAAMLVILREELDPRLLLPVMWIWAQTHGSFPLGVVVVVAAALGGGLDRDAPVVLSPSAHARRSVLWVSVGALAGGIVNPYGPRLLLFPFRLLGDTEALRDVSEWQHPELFAPSSVVVVLGILLVVVRCARVRNLRDPLLLGVMVMLWWSAQRNLAPLVVVGAPLAAAHIPTIGSLRGSEPIRPRVAVVVAVSAALFGAAVLQLRQPSVDESVYPAALIDELEASGELGGRIVHREFVGNYLEFRFDGDVPVYFDDRYELHQTALILQHRALVRGTVGWQGALEQWGPDLVIWNLDEPLAALLDAESDWKRTYQAGRWAAWEPNGRP